MAGYLCYITALLRKTISRANSVFNWPREMYHVTLLYMPLFGAFQK